MDFPKDWECAGFSETDKWAIKIYQKHFPEHKNYGDARTINPDKLPDFDLLCGGFPCQAFSVAGRRRGFEDTRGTLFFEIARIAKAKRPRYLLLENVKGLLNHDKGNTFATILTTLSELGYDLQWECLNSKNFGVPQNRERVFIVGHPRGEYRPQIFPLGQDGGILSKTYTESKNIAKALLQIGTGLYAVKGDLFSRKNPQGQYGFDGKNMFALRVAVRHAVLDRTQIRRLTPLECERLQGFPDGWTGGISDTQKYKCLGNAVTVNVIKAVAEKMEKEIGCREPSPGAGALTPSSGPNSTTPSLREANE